MSNQIKAADPKKEEVTIQENYEDNYWLKTYGVSSEELKKSGKNLKISDKIIKANFENKAYA
ncbi:MAG TPA: hypothetical protein VGN20_18905 [Mucilaginibacter sp.]|jgi:hypothetical protein